MEIGSENWKIKELIKKKHTINPRPQYQRTPVWSNSKKVFLIDSILRKYDLPKFYIKETPTDPAYDYEVTDGQQRMRAIWEFVEGKFKLEGKEITHSDYAGCDYNNLPVDYKRSIKEFSLTFAIIKEASQEEIRTLFARLQMGMSLIPVELRHALASNIGTNTYMITETHKFFKTSRISNKRFKHQDYLDHVIALMYYNNEKDIKAPALYQLYLDLSSAQNFELSIYLRKANKILGWMYEVNDFAKGIFKNKWGFVDSYWLFYNLYDNISLLNPIEFANNLSAFEVKRKKYNPNPEVLIEDKKSTNYDKDLYDYIEAFNKQGALKKNISIRYRVFRNKFKNNLNFTFKDDKI